MYGFLSMSLYNYVAILPFKGVDYSPLLEPEHMEQIPRNQDSSSTSINIPTGLPFENSIQTTTFVSEKIFIQCYESLFNFVFIC